MKELLKSKLNRYDYSYSENKNQIIIKLGLSQLIKVEFSENNTVKISDKLKGWNFLTGIIEMSIKGAMIYQTISIVLASLLFLFLKKEYLFYLLIIAAIWVVLWTVYYLIKAENMKTKIITWLETIK